MIDIDSLTIGEAKQIAKVLPQSSSTSHFFEVGKNYLIRTVTLYYTGHLAAIMDNDLLLTEAAWIVDTGRFSDGLISGVLVEIEPFCDPVIVSRSAIIDATQWRHPLPRTKK